MGRSLDVVFVNENEEIGFLSYLHHFKATKLAQGYRVIDWLGRGFFVDFSTKNFIENFLIIEADEFKEYEKYVYEGEATLLEKYFSRLCEKYNLER